MYESLIKYGYRDNSGLEMEYSNRLNSYSAIRTNLIIKPFSQQKQERIISKDYELFCFLIPEHFDLMEKILLNSKEINSFADNRLPKGALRHLEISQIVNEIKSTNDIEGVKSTKQEIKIAINAQETKQTVRFKHTVESYLSILRSEKPSIKDISDIRKIYDNIVADEIDSDNKLDGQYFRKESVTVFDERNNRVVHRGSPSETQIHNDLSKLIVFMNNDEIPFLIKCLITHYHFEYIHPFYDGNGRVGRYIMSSYLAFKLDRFTALSLSESIYNNKKKYEDIFMDASNINNKGDLTLFVYEMLKIIVKGQKKILEDLELATFQMNNIVKFIKENSELNEDQGNVLFIVLQHYLFTLPEELIINTDIKEVLGKDLSRNRIDRAMESLERLGYVKKIKNRPISYQVLDERLIHLK